MVVMVPARMPHRFEADQRGRRSYPLLLDRSPFEVNRCPLDAPEGPPGFPKRGEPGFVECCDAEAPPQQR
ncbi:MAG: hypothetical protein ABI724_15060 [Betaproteobacteria bacterium]